MHAVTLPRLLAFSFFVFQGIAALAVAGDAPPPTRILLRTGHLLDTRNGKEAADQTIVVVGGVISAIAPTADTPRQAADREFDLHAMTVLPGLIDVHTHLTMDTNFDPYHVLSTSIAQSALIGAHNAKLTLQAGFTTVRNVGAEGFADVDLRDAIKVAAHAHGAQGILWATQTGVDSIEHGSYMSDEDIAAMKQHGTYFVPTAYLIDWMQQYGKLPPFYQQKMRDVSAVEKANAKRAIAAHVKVALGPGKWADIIAVNGDPLNDVRLLQHVAFVMKSGVVYKSETP